MIKRIVMMYFQPEKLDEFLTLFESTKSGIRNFPGCNHLELWEDINHPGRLFTYSYWETEQALEIYRNSSLFKTTWAKTKVLFKEKPQAWSVVVKSINPK